MVLFKRLRTYLRYHTQRGTIFDWERAGFPGLFILATGSKHQHVSIERQKESGAGFLIVQDLGNVAYQVEPTFDEVCRWSMTRFVGIQYGWWRAPRFGPRRTQRGRTGGAQPNRR